MNRLLGIFCGLLLLVVVISAITVSYYAWKQRKLVNELYAQKIKRDDLLAVWSDLILEHSTLASLARVEHIAINQLDMNIPRDDNIYKVKP